MARVCERHVLEESDHGVDVGPPLSIAQREFGLPRRLGYEEWVAPAECTAYTGHCGRMRDAFTTVSNTIALRSATVAQTVPLRSIPWRKVNGKKGGAPAPR
jgi:hypothetical protein